MDGLTGEDFDIQQDGYKMVPIKLIGCATVFGKCELYGGSGFHGFGHKNVRKYDNRSATVGGFTKVEVGGGNGQS